ncbi:D-inositol-3-phosphate glycosyltransferase [Aquipuribacter sp. MA13-6]|uniref:D-inositol-3-phosphate glycosyltransferase n=1 Tax=unclassified Aquipuribacter TaxID=2635084 RepID=UPI003EEAB855
MLSVHTSPLEQPGTGDAGGMNVYVVELSRRLAALGVAVEVFTRRTSGAQADVVDLAPGVQVRHVDAGPYEGLAKEDLPGQLCAFTAGLMRAAAEAPDGHYDLVHSHYWLSGQVGWLFAERWGVPLVHTMHTMAKVKNEALATGDVPEPRGRLIGEEQVVRAADRLVANTDDEAADLGRHYDADPAHVGTVPPGVDLQLFRPGDRRAARARLGLPADADVLLFVGRIQPLKAPDVLVAAAARLRADRGPSARPLVVVVLGGPSGSGLARPTALLEQAAALGLDDVLITRPPVPRAELADWYRAADLVTVPSYNESFGLVALEAQACGTPVVAAAVGGLRAAVRDGVSGVLVQGHDPQRWADTIGPLLADPQRRADLGRAAVEHASGFGWQVTARRMLEQYDRAEQTFARRPGRRPVGGPSPAPVVPVAPVAGPATSVPALDLLRASG